LKNIGNVHKLYNDDFWNIFYFNINRENKDDYKQPAMLVWFLCKYSKSAWF